MDYKPRSHDASDALGERYHAAVCSLVRELFDRCFTIRAPHYVVT